MIKKLLKWARSLFRRAPAREPERWVPSIVDRVLVPTEVMKKLLKYEASRKWVGEALKMPPPPKVDK